jgi:Zn-dependent protease
MHEAAHAWVAWRMGDQRDYMAKRKTPFSFSHISLIFTIIMPSALMLYAGVMLGGAKPVMVRSDIGPGKMALVAAAGPIANIFCGILCMGIVGGLVYADVLHTAFDPHYQYAKMGVFLNFMLAALNLLPIPPFDGSRIVAMFLPEKVRRIYLNLAIPCIILLLIAFYIGYKYYFDDMMRVQLKVLALMHDGIMLFVSWIS